MSHPQAYLNGSEVIAASPSLEGARLVVPEPGGDALLVTEVEGHGLVVARFTGGFTHVVTGLDRPGIELWNAPFWRSSADERPHELAELPPGPSLALATGPPGVREALVDAALAGHVTLVDPDHARRAAWIA